MLSAKVICDLIIISRQLREIRYSISTALGHVKIFVINRALAIRFCLMFLFSLQNFPHTSPDVFSLPLLFICTTSFFTLYSFYEIYFTKLLSLRAANLFSRRLTPRCDLSHLSRAALLSYLAYSCVFIIEIAK